MERLVRLWFGFSTRIDRRTYVVSGVVLMLVKYLLDATVARGVTGAWWSPWPYLVPLWSVRMAQFQPAPSGLFLWLGLMTLPFFWIGVSMSVRRAADAGLPPFLGLGFAIPGVNFLAGYLTNRPVRSPLITTLSSAVLATMLTAGGLLLFALEGVICIAMAAPIALTIVIVGALIGRAVAIHGRPATASPGMELLRRRAPAAPRHAASEPQGRVSPDQAH